MLDLDEQDCEPVYSFRHVLDFTSEVRELQGVLNSSRLSASPDHPEAVLDAMLQSALCEVGVVCMVRGWREGRRECRLEKLLWGGGRNGDGRL